MTVYWVDTLPKFNGQLTNLNKLLLQCELANLIGLNFKPSWLDNLIIEGTDNKSANEPELNRAILDLNIAKLERVSIAFEPGQSDLSEQAFLGTQEHWSSSDFDCFPIFFWGSPP